jgi:hypothetical protein
MQRSESIAALAAALAKAQGLIEGAVKGNINPAFRSKYADLGAVWDAIREPLTGNGIALLQQLSTEENRVACTTLVTHASGEWIEFAPFVVPVSKQDAQGFGSAATYCRRYSLMAAVGIAPIDDDGESAVGRASAPKPAVQSVPTRDVSPDRAQVVRKVADACIAAHAAGDDWRCYEEACAIADSEERLLLWDYLHSHSAVRSAIKRMKDAEAATAAKAAA